MLETIMVDYSKISLKTVNKKKMLPSVKHFVATNLRACSE